MLRYRFIIPLLFVFCIHTTYSQEFFKAITNKKIYTKAELEKLIKRVNEVSAKKNDATIFNTSYKVLRTYTRNDSVIHEFDYVFKSIPSKKEKIFSFENKPFPNFKFKNLKGEKITEKDLKGSITVVNIWFINCLPCRREMPILNILHEKYKDKVDFKSITFDSKDKVKAFLKTNKYTFEHMLTSKYFLKKHLGVQAYPKVIIVNRDGIVEYVGNGIPPTFDEKTKKVNDFTEDDLTYLEVILDKLLKK